MSQDASLQPVATKLSDLDARLSQASAALARRNTTGLVIALLLAVGIAIYLFWAYSKINNELTPQTIAQGLRGHVVSQLDANSAMMGQRLADTAPMMLDAVEKRVQDLPPQMAEHLRTQIRTQLDRHMPELEAEIEQSIRAGLAAADAQIKAAEGKTDEERMRSLLSSMAQVFGDQSTQALEDFRNKYRDGSKDILAHLEFLAEGRNLDREAQLQRDVIVRFLTLAQHYETISGQGDPTQIRAVTGEAGDIPGTK